MSRRAAPPAPPRCAATSTGGTHFTTTAKAFNGRTVGLHIFAGGCLPNIVSKSSGP
eukprot:CAMPEP_0172763790 /NCGR_PEP_ID=MMETSP1074-20121228/176050_1 /TAXON_ID=2916 /ORGANISM="Ceratium fusus, Strain PA161109" /LENGTH=55 /DNA_ID=CAMNT_0013598443 /DNA_START=976 /DNA_END=1140 /DNA_ORIENTATION=+